jgi:radical SAM/Cys-rich protein
MTNLPKLIDFSSQIKEKNIAIKRVSIETLQINLGKLCNQACNHCHVEAGPNRTENMEKKTVERILELLDLEPQIHTIDLTGGAPELNPHFRYMVQAIKGMGKEVIDRCNLTVLFEPGHEDTANFLRDQKVQIVASLPCYIEENVDGQRGNGVFQKSIKALKLFNDLGYGKPGTGLSLNLVYNPTGADLPGEQKELERSYKLRLKDDWDIEFNQLFAIANMPIKRFAHFLWREGLMDHYLKLLADNFNSQAAKDVMCTRLISIGWDGQIFDCDFNQMLDIPVGWKLQNIWDIDRFSQLDQKIALENHCYGCTAGSGSSCGGALT